MLEDFSLWEQEFATPIYDSLILELGDPFFFFFLRVGIGINVTPEEKLEKILSMHRRLKDSVLCGHCLRTYPCPTVSVIKPPNIYG